jgi:hypothetical protein
MRVARRAAVRLITRLTIQMIFTLTSDAVGLGVKPGSDELEGAGIWAPREESCWEIWSSSTTVWFW